MMKNEISNDIKNVIRQDLSANFSNQFVQMSQNYCLSPKLSGSVQNYILVPTAKLVSHLKMDSTAVS